MNAKEKKYITHVYYGIVYNEKIYQLALKDKEAGNTPAMELGDNTGDLDLGWFTSFQQAAIVDDIIKELAKISNLELDSIQQRAEKAAAEDYAFRASDKYTPGYWTSRNAWRSKPRW